MRRPLLLLCALVLPLAACAAVMNALEGATDENTAEGKLIRGANRLRKSFQDLDPSEEHFIGRSVAAQILAMPDYPVVADEELNDYLAHIGHAIVATNDKVRHPFLDYRFGVLDTAEVNAFACPGGLILVSRGLLDKATSEDEVAAIVAHEIAHVTLRHGVAAIQKANLAQAFTYLGAGAAQATMKQEDLDKLTELFDGSVDDIVQTLVTSGYSRDAEAAADALGREFLANTGYDPQALARVLGHMQDAGGDGGMFATHPAPKDRINSLGGPTAYVADANAEAARRSRFATIMKR
ncbi:MAG: M48 family metalloprotease [Planctomycetes bacterium]|nr:M48 family metalloprotease [Planctomycetota bacterium]